MNADLTGFSAAIFDLDGTLADSNTVWEKLDRIILEKYGITADDEFIVRLASLTYQQAADAMRKLGVPISDERFTEEINELARIEYANNIQLKSYASELLHEMKNSGKKIVLRQPPLPSFTSPYCEETMYMTFLTALLQQIKREKVRMSPMSI